MLVNEDGCDKQEVRRYPVSIWMLAVGTAHQVVGGSRKDTHERRNLSCAEQKTKHDTTQTCKPRLLSRHALHIFALTHAHPSALPTFCTTLCCAPTCDSTVRKPENAADIFHMLAGLMITRA